jgi:hypothetical protein
MPVSPIGDSAIDVGAEAGADMAASSHQESALGEPASSATLHDESAAFSQSLREAAAPKTTTEDRGGALVRRTSPFQSLDDAGRAALDRANPDSIAHNEERGGNLYERQTPQGRTFGYTGPIAGTKHSFNPLDPRVRVPPETNWDGTFHTHGNFSKRDPRTGTYTATGDPSKDDYYSSVFSRNDLKSQKMLATKGATLEEGVREQAIKNLVGAPPGEEIKFYLGTPSGDPKDYLVHNPTAPTEKATAPRYPDNNKLMRDGGTVLPLLPRES